MRLAARLAAVLTACLAAQAAAARSITIEDFHADLHVHEDRLVTVTETIRFRFEGSWNGIYRTIPIQYRDHGFNYTLRLAVEQVTDADGGPLRYKTSRERHYRKIKVWVPGARDDSRTVVIRYRVTNALRFFDRPAEGGGGLDEAEETGYDELYWNVTGDEWPFQILSASARIVLPDGVTGVRARAWTGTYRSTARDATVRVDGKTTTVETTSALGVREGLTASVIWDPGVVSRPGPLDKAFGFFRSNVLLLVPFLAFGGMFPLWRRRGRDPRALPIVTRYEPPDGLTPAEVGTLVDSSPDMRDITATIVDLAVRGFLRIEEKETGGVFGMFKDTDYEFTRLEGPSDSDLKPHEKAVLDGIFRKSGQTASLTDLKNEFYKDLPGIRDDLYDALMARGYYPARPDKVTGAWLGGAIALGVVAGIGMVWFSRHWGLSMLTAIVAAALTLAVLVVFASLMPKRTTKGARAREAVLGFEEFLGKVEADRFRRMITGPEMFEKYLPYAMALGVEEKWARAFSDLYTKPPDWYRGARFDNFSAAMFASRLGGMTTQAAHVMTSSPRSSGGSGFGGGGFSGGGFSGGGFGGGGGGGF